MKRFFWSFVRVVASPGKNLWVCAAKQQQSISCEKKKKERKRQTDRKQLIDSMNDFNRRVDRLISQVKEGQHVN